MIESSASQCEAGNTLEPITFVRTFWFAWAAFQPDTVLIEG